MCASWSGHRAAVRLLLQHGAAWVGVVDTQGRDAKDLALEGMKVLVTSKSCLCVVVSYLRSCVVSAAGHTDVFEELESHGRSTEREAPSSSK